MDGNIIKLEDVSISYQKKVVLEKINFSLPAGKIIGILGPNGSGKTTMLKGIMGLIPLLAGQISIFGKKFKEVRTKISYVPQRGSVDWDFPASVMDVVLMGRANPMNIFKRYSKEDKIIALEAIQKVKLEAFKNRQISELSGGQQQRVFLARALAKKADLYILDEPFAGVDIPTETAIVEILKEMKNEGKSILVVHHDLQTAKSYFDWLVLLNRTLVAQGPIEQTFTLENLQNAYGKKLAILDEVNYLIAEK